MYKNKASNIVFPLLLGVGVAVGLIIGWYLGQSGPSHNSSRRGAGATSNSKLNYTISLIDKMYVDPVNLDSIGEKVIPLLVEQLDPHSVYIPASELTEANEDIDGQFDGIGVVFNMATDTIIVMNVISSGPSDKAGVLNGDRIIKINDSLVAGQKIDQNNIVKRLRGKRGTTVTLGIERQNIKDLVPITVTRGIIPIKSIDAAFMIRPTVGFMKLTTFSKTSFRDMRDALKRLTDEGMTRLILDVRGNSGGLLDQAILIANEFMPEGELIVYTLDRDKNRTEEYSNGNGTETEIPLVVLIDEGSASASEILAGAIQDNDRGTVIGRRSFGKGLVQQQFEYRDKSALRLTIARYYTPTGRSIQKPYTSKDDYQNDLINRYDHNEFFSADSIKFADSLKYQTPGGRTVYGGGGIMPDIFIPMDTTDMTHYYLEVIGRNILYKYTLEYSDRHRAKLNAISSLTELQAFLDADKGLTDNFIAYASARGVAPNKEQIAKSRTLITAQLKAYIGRNSKLEDAGFYVNILPIDPVIQKAIEELEKQ